MQPFYETWSGVSFHHIDPLLDYMSVVQRQKETATTAAFLQHGQGQIYSDADASLVLFILFAKTNSKIWTKKRQNVKLQCCSCPASDRAEFKGNVIFGFIILTFT